VNQIEQSVVGEQQVLERQLDRTVDRAVGSGINVELLWSVFETRLRRAINGGNER
jgi:hypothetical protein